MGFKQIDDMEAAKESEAPRVAPTTFQLAAILARKGRYAEATKLLQSAVESGECKHEDALDLQARMLAQQGLYLQAEAYWQKAQEIGGDKSKYDQALSQLRSPRHSMGWIGSVAVGLALVLVVFLLFWQVAVVNPGVANEINSTNQSISGFRGEFSVFQTEQANVTTDFIKEQQQLNRLVQNINTQFSFGEADAKKREELVASLTNGISAVQAKLIGITEANGKHNVAIQQLELSLNDLVAGGKNRDSKVDGIEKAVKSLDQEFREASQKQGKAADDLVSAGKSTSDSITDLKNAIKSLEQASSSHFKAYSNQVKSLVKTTELEDMKAKLDKLEKDIAGLNGLIKARPVEPNKDNSKTPEPKKTSN